MSFTGVGTCPNPFPPPPGTVTGQIANADSTAMPTSVTNAAQTCADSFHLREVVSYHPIAQYWPLQWLEASIFVGLAVALAAFSLWWVVRRLT